MTYNYRGENMRGILVAVDFFTNHTKRIFFCASLLHGLTAFTANIKLSGKLLECPRVNIRFDRNIPGPGFVEISRYSDEKSNMVLNPDILNQMPKMARWFVFNHECAHTFAGPDERKADLVAVDLSYRQGWMNQEAVNQICEDFRGQPGDGDHEDGDTRCRYISNRFKELIQRDSNKLGSRKESSDSFSKSKNDNAESPKEFQKIKPLKIHDNDESQPKQCRFVSHSDESKIIKLIKTRWIKDGKELNETEIDRLSAEEFQKALTVPILNLVRHGKRYSLTGFTTYGSSGLSKIAHNLKDRTITIDGVAIDFAYLYINRINLGKILGCANDQPETIR